MRFCDAYPLNFDSLRATAVQRFAMELPMNKLNILLATVAAINTAAIADPQSHTQPQRADSHAPIGIMGDHMHNAGEWMVSYRAMSMTMEGNLLGSNAISDDAIATTQANPYAGMPMMPPTLRVVPQRMTTTMHMLGMMYAPGDNITLMAMLNYMDKSMTLKSYQGMMGNNVLGEFKSDVSGMGDTTIGALYRLYETTTHHLHLNAAISLPTGATDKEGTVLTPMNMQPTVRLPYAMQLGSGTYDLLPGITYTGKADNISWGAQYMATIRTGDNDEGYTLGDIHRLNGWAQYAWAPSISTSLGLAYSDSGDIEGRDANIMLPVQTANPANYGRQQSSAKVGLNWVGQKGALHGHRLAFEYSVPLKQSVNGLQMEMQNMWVLGYQKAF